MCLGEAPGGRSDAPDFRNVYWRCTDGGWRLRRRCDGDRSKADCELGRGRQELRRCDHARACGLEEDYRLIHRACSESLLHPPAHGYVATRKEAMATFAQELVDGS